jgi:hypothetical protein
MLWRIMKTVFGGLFIYKENLEGITRLTEGFEWK